MWFFFALGGGLVQAQRSLTRHDATLHVAQHGAAQHVFEASLAGAIVLPLGQEPLGRRRTLAEMSTAQKNRLSMRRLALAKMAHFLRIQGSLDAPRAPSTSTHARC